MSQFIFKAFSYDQVENKASFTYENNGYSFTEVIDFGNQKPVTGYSHEALQEALFLAFIAIGTSYYKTFPTTNITFASPRALTEYQATYFTKIYQEGLSQFAYENDLTRQSLAHFSATRDEERTHITATDNASWLIMQSGGKDSILTASILTEKHVSRAGWYIGSRFGHPSFINKIIDPVYEVRRQLDAEQLRQASDQGGLNGHVPVTLIVTACAIIHAVLTGKNGVIVSVAHEGEEAHDYIDDLAVNHQWAKTWEAETLLAEYVERYIMKGFRVGSVLRSMSELRVAELFVEKSWPEVGTLFSSCNLANYKQGHDNETLLWCGDCSKCLNSFLLFAPFVDPQKLIDIVGHGENLLHKPSLQGYLRGLLGIEGIKPFECVGEVDELRLAYHMACQRWPQAGYELSYDVPHSDFDYMKRYEHQAWVDELGVL